MAADRAEVGAVGLAVVVVEQHRETNEKPFSRRRGTQHYNLQALHPIMTGVDQEHFVCCGECNVELWTATGSLGAKF